MGSNSTVCPKTKNFTYTFQFLDNIGIDKYQLGTHMVATESSIFVQLTLA